MRDGCTRLQGEIKNNPLAEERVRLREELRESDPLEVDHHGDEAGGLGWLEGVVRDEHEGGQGDY